MSIGVWDLWAVAVKALLYAATLAAAGGAFYLVYTRSLLEDSDRRALARPILVLIAVALAAGAARFAVTAASMSGAASGAVDGELLRMVWESGEGRAAWIRTAGLLLVVPASLGRGRPGPLALTGAVAAASSFAWVGHTHATGPAAAPVLVGAHLLCAAFWLGALAPLWIYARNHEPRRIAAVAGRFGRAALVLVSVLIGAGAAVLAILLGHWSAFWSSPYGRTACVKLALAAALLACAAYNKLVLMPRLAVGERSAVRALRLSIGAEMALAASILIATAALTTLTGPAET
jgi:copper resistance protein D